MYQFNDWSLNKIHRKIVGLHHVQSISNLMLILELPQQVHYLGVGHCDIDPVLGGHDYLKCHGARERVDCWDHISI